MQYAFDTKLAFPYHSLSQQIRVMSENWLCTNMYCPRCGEKTLKPCKNNTPAQDFYCKNCQEPFELKSTHHRIGNKITDGSYNTMIQKIQSETCRR